MRLQCCLPYLTNMALIMQLHACIQLGTLHVNASFVRAAKHFMGFHSGGKVSYTCSLSTHPRSSLDGWVNEHITVARSIHINLFF